MNYNENIYDTQLEEKCGRNSFIVVLVDDNDEILKINNSKFRLVKNGNERNLLCTWEWLKKEFANANLVSLIPVVPVYYEDGDIHYLEAILENLNDGSYVLFRLDAKGFERRFIPEDIENGNYNPVAYEYYKKRGLINGE